MPDLSCDDVRDLLPELAAGVASGDDRARAMTHLTGCLTCRRELAELTAVLDGLVLLAPEHEPSPGFESAVLAAVAPDRGAERRWRTAALGLAAALVALALAAGAGWWQVSHQADPAVAAVRYEGGGQVGEAVAHGGDRPWVFLRMDAVPEPGRYLVRLVTDDRRRVDVGWCQVRGGKGSWGWVVDVAPDDMRSVELVDASGAVAMRGRFS